MPAQTSNNLRPKRWGAWRYILFGVFLFLGAGLVRAGVLPADLGVRLTQAYITPAMQNFQRSAGEFHANLVTWCAAPSDAGKQTIQEGFKDLVLAWSGIEFLRFGPLVAANRFERVYFWPDPRAIMPRQVQSLLADQAGVPDVAGLAKHSVAVQGLPALEYVLYRDGGVLADSTGESFSPSCEYAASVAGNLAVLGAELAAAWGEGGEYAQKFSQPSASNVLYRNTQEVAGEAIKAISGGLQFTRDIKLLPVLGANMDNAKYQRAPFWRSGLTSQAIGAAAEGMLRFYQAGAWQYRADDIWIDASLQDELRRVRDNFNDMPDRIEKSVRQPDTYRQLTLGTLLLKNAKRLVDEDVAPALGVRIGFNALDGD